jgi:multiple sugar transport system permease protein
MSTITQTTSGITGQRPIFLRKWRHWLKRTFQYSVLILWAIFSLFPVYWTFASSIKEPQDVFAIPVKWTFKPTQHNYEVVWGLKVGTEIEGVEEATAGQGQTQFPRYLANTLIIASGTAFFSLFFGSLAAYSLARGRFRARRTIMAGILITRLIPPVVILVPIYVIWRSLHLLDTHLGLIIAYMTFNLPFTIWMMYGFFVDLPAELEEAAMVDGCTRIEAFVRILLPLAAPGLAVTAVFLILGAWNDFLFSSVLAGDTAKTLSPSILHFITDKAILWGRLYAAGSTILVPVVVFTLLVQRYMGIGLTGGALKG